MILRGGVLFLALAVCVPAAASDIELVKDKRGQWRMRVDGKNYFIRGVDYRYSRIGESPDDGTLRDWAGYDFDNNGKNDPAYDAWVDANKNGARDADEPAAGDFELLRRMGCNTIRWYVNDAARQAAPKALLRDLFKTYGIRVAVGDKFGAYTIGSGAAWKDGTDYRDARQQDSMLASVRRMVDEHKTEPYTLIWLLGNENNLRFTNTNAARYPLEYAQFINRAAKMIHEMDPTHPVALVNGDTQMMNYYKKYCPDVDIFGTNVYRGPKGFGSLWKEVSAQLGKPVLVTEYGGSAAHGDDEDAQAAYHRASWLDIWANRAGHGQGNALGGIAFEWADEWWKAGEPSKHAGIGTVGKQGVGAAGWNQEYCGITAQGDGKQSPFLRQLRKVYFMYQKLWNGTA